MWVILEQKCAPHTPASSFYGKRSFCSAREAAHHCPKGFYFIGRSFLWNKKAPWFTHEAVFVFTVCSNLIHENPIGFHLSIPKHMQSKPACASFYLMGNPACRHRGKSVFDAYEVVSITFAWLNHNFYLAFFLFYSGYCSIKTQLLIFVNQKLPP